MARKKSKSPTQLKDEVKKLRSSLRHAALRNKAYKQGIKDGLDLSKDARRD